jgi:high affinity Mn2+ porin
VLASTNGTSSRAADLMAKRRCKLPPQSQFLNDWTGAYIGGHVGYSRGYGRNTRFDPDPTAAGTSFGSLFGGLQFGYNHALPSRMLLGIEGDISCPNYLDDGIVASRSTPFSSVTEKLDFVSTIRGRVGYTALRNLREGKLKPAVRFLLL